MFNDIEWEVIIYNAMSVANKNGERYAMITLPHEIAIKYLYFFSGIGFDVNIRPIGRWQNKVKLVVGW